VRPGYPEAPVPGGMARRTAVPEGAWGYLLVLAAVTIGAYTGLRLTGPPRQPAAIGLYLVVVVVGLGSVVVGMRTHRPAYPAAWWLLLAGYAVSLAGEVQDQLTPGAAFPSIRDATFLASYVLFIAALLLMARARIVDGHGGEAALDSLIVTIAFILLCCRFLAFPTVLQPYLANAAVSQTAHAAAIAYLVADALLLAMAVLVVAGRSLRPVPVALLVAAVTLILVDDSFSTARTVAGNGPVTVGLLSSYALAGAAALHPSMPALTQPTGTIRPSLTRLRIGLLLAAVTLTALVLGVDEASLSPGLASFLVVGVVALALLVFARLGGLADAITGQVRRYERLLDLSVRGAEQERVQVAADLHDGPIQRLVTIELAAELAKRQFAKGNYQGVSEALAELTDDLGQEIEGLRRVMVELRPPALEELGLAQALAAYAAEFERRTGIRCDLSLDLAADLGPPRETILYRVMVEVLTNVVKHAKAKHAWIGVTATPDIATLTIRDDGGGFDPATLQGMVEHGHFGLAGARHRVEFAGGEFMVASQPGMGTTISVQLPLPPPTGSRLPPPAGS
jgi:signal transduction histidine kinase